MPRGTRRRRVQRVALRAAQLLGAQIATHQVVDRLRRFEAQLGERQVAITLEPDARAWLANKGYDPLYGARPLARVVQSEVRNPLTDDILFGRLQQGGTVRIGLADDALTFDVEADSQAAAPGDVPGAPARTPEEATSD